MLDDVTIETLRPHVGASFAVRLPDGEAWPIVLTEVHASPDGTGARVWSTRGGKLAGSTFGRNTIRAKTRQQE